jgi:serine/threonine protein kinase
VILTADSDGNLTAVKTAVSQGVIEMFERGLNNLKKLNHPLIVKPHFVNRTDGKSAIVTEFVGNGSLADHLPGSPNCDLCTLQGPTRTVRILAGICVAMCFIHSRGIIHTNLTPENILLDWNWKAMISGFGHSVSQGEPYSSDTFRDPHYLAPEQYRNQIIPESDVFSFGLILYELIVGRAVFPRDLAAGGIMGEVLAEGWKPDIPESLFPETRELISDCLQIEFQWRPSFDEIFDRMEGMNCKLTAGVNSSKVAKFVKEIKTGEKEGNPETSGQAKPRQSPLLDETA